MWVICSGRSGQMSDCDRIAQVAHEKWANVSDLLRSLRTNERQIARFCSKWFILSFAHKIIRKKLYFCTLFTVFYKFKKKTKNLLIPSEQSERIAQVAQDKWATMSDSLRSLRRNERSWANRSGRSLFSFLAINKRFAPKFDEQIPNPALKCLIILLFF